MFNTGSVLVVIAVSCFVFFIIGYGFGKSSPCTDVEQTDMWKVPTQ